MLAGSEFHRVVEEIQVSSVQRNARKVQGELGCHHGVTVMSSPGAGEGAGCLPPI